MNKLNNTINKLFNTRKKRNIFAVLLLGLIALVGVTIAYFGTDIDFKNLFKSKPFNTTVYEVFESPDSWTPGTTTPKEVYATNDSDVDVMVRVSYTEQWLDSNGNELPLEQNGNRAAIINLSNTQDWTKNRHYYNYNYTLKPGETTSSFMESVTFNQEITGSYECITDENGHDICTSTGTGYDGATYKLIITVEMMQADGEFYEDPRCQENETCIAQINDTKYISLEGALDSAVDGDTIFMINNTTESVVNTKDVTLDLNGYTVTGAEDVTIQNNGKLRIIGGGSLENDTGTTIINEGTLQLGDNDGTVSQEIPEINGTGLGIEQNGIFNFYDGIITAEVAVAGLVTDKPEESIVYVDHLEENNYQEEYLIDTMSSRAVAMLNGVLYVNLQDAINTEEANSTNGTIYMIRDAELAYTLTIQNEESNIILDLDGYNIETGYTITNNGNLKLIDEGDTKGSLKPSVTLTNNKNLIIDGVTIAATTDVNVINNTSSLSIYNSNISANAGYVIYNTGNELNFNSNINFTTTNYAIYNKSTEQVEISEGNITGLLNDGNLKINGGTFTNGSQYYALESEGGTIHITDGSFVSAKNTGALLSHTTSIIDGGYFKGPNTGLYLGSSSKTTINNVTTEATATGSYGTRNNGTVTINDGTFKGVLAGLYNDAGPSTINGGEYVGEDAIRNDATLNIYDAKVNGTTNGIRTYTTVNIYGGNIYGDYNGIIVDNGGRINVYDGTITGATYGIRNYTTSNIYGGTITGGVNGVQNEKNTLVIGTQDDTVSIEKPIIIGTSTHGVNIVSGTFKFYDGILKGQTNGHNGDPSEIPDGYYIESGNDTINEMTYNTTYLIEQPNIVKVGDIEYNSLGKAIDSIETEGTIEFIADPIIKSVITIPEGKTITIDLAGHTINTTQQLLNYGSLILKDSSDNKTGEFISSVDAVAIKSDGTLLQIDNGQYTNITDDLILSKNETIINNGLFKAPLGYGIDIDASGTESIIKDGTFESKNTTIELNSKTTIENASITSTSSVGISIYAAVTINNINVYAKTNGVMTGTSGNLIINNGNINSESYAIYLSYGKITVNNATVTSNDRAIQNSYGTLTVNDGDFKGTNRGLSNGATSYIYGGTFEGGSYGIITDTKLVLGTEGDEVNNSSPTLIGGIYGLYTNTQEVSFYDGILKGQTAGYYGIIGTIEDKYTIGSSTETINEKIYQTNFLVEQTYYAKVGEQTFNSLNEAVAAIEKEGNIEIIANANITETVTIPAEKNITVNLAGYTITTTKQIINQGSLTIEDSSGSDTGTINSTFKGNQIISLGTSFTLNSGTIANTTTNRLVYIEKGEVIFNGGKLNSSSGITLYVYKTATNLTINYAEINTTGIGIETHVPTIVNDINITSSSTGISSNNSLVFEKGNIISEHTGISASGTSFIMNNGNINANSIGINCYTNTSINNGTIYGKNYGIQNYINSSNYSLNILGGTITGGTYGVYTYYGITNIGKDDGVVDATKPIVLGGSYGVYIKNGTTFNFYDGILKGKTNATSAEASTIATDTEKVYGEETINEQTYITLKLTPLQNFIKNGETEYKNLQTAIDEAKSGDTLTFIASAINYDGVTIPEDKEITIDLAGNYVGTTKTITNNGTLTIMDSNETPGTIEILATYILLENNQTLNISNIYIKNSITTNYIIKQGTNSKLNLDSVNVSGKAPIYSNAESTVNIKNSEFEMTKTNAVYVQKSNLTIENTNMDSGATNYQTVAFYGANNTLEVKDSYIQTLVISSTGSGSTNTATITNSEVYNLSGNITNTEIYDSTITNNLQNGSSSYMEVNNSKINGYVTNYGTELAIKNNTIITTVNQSNAINNHSTLINITDSTINYTTQNSTGTRNIITNSGSGTINLNNTNMIINNTYNSANSRVNALYNNSSGVINYNNSKTEIISATNATSTGGYNNSTGQININSGTIYIDGGSTSTGVYVKNGEVNMIDGNINISNATTAYGAYIYEGTFIQGTQDGEVNQEIPSLIAVGTTGIGVKKENGYFKYYDGKITGSTNAKPETTTEVEYQYEVTTYNDEETGYEYCVLEYMES